MPTASLSFLAYLISVDFVDITFKYNTIINMPNTGIFVREPNGI
jgi:hypothetical protein